MNKHEINSHASRAASKLLEPNMQDHQYDIMQGLHVALCDYPPCNISIPYKAKALSSSANAIVAR